MPPRRYDIVKPHYFARELIMSRINTANENFSKIVYMRITFVCSNRFMYYDYYLKQKLPICEIKSSQILNRNPSLINLLNRELPHPLVNRYNYIPNEEEDIE